MLKVLIAEDDLMIADMIETVLVDAGYAVCGIGRTVAAAVELARIHKPDLAVIDLHLADDGLGTEITAQLAPLGGLGVLYATGNVATLLLSSPDGHGCISKPYRSPDLLRSLEIVAEIVATGSASLPFPRGFQVLPKATSEPQVPSHG